MPNFVCPICSSSECKLESVNDIYDLVRCKEGYTFGVGTDIFLMEAEKRDKIFNLIFEHLLCTPYYEERKYWYFYYNPEYIRSDQDQPKYVNLANALLSYPNSFIEVVNRALINLSSLHPKYGDTIGYSNIDFRAAYCKNQSTDYYATEFFDLMVDMGYLIRKDERASFFTISAEGWKKADELQKKQQEVNQGFIAMSFCDETKSIREAFRKAISEAGFAARIIDEKQHNNQIVPEIFYEIQRSKFVVVDVTYPNYGAYYEAGYAQALSKEVIVCCRGDVFRGELKGSIRPHFDISQKAMVVWEDENDLVQRLKNRIEATVR